MTFYTSDSLSLTATIITSRNELENKGKEWNELLSFSNADTVFLTYEWISVWFETVYPDASLFVVFIRDSDGRLIAIAPFYRSSLYLLGLVKYDCLRIIGDCHSGAEYGNVIIRHGFEEKAMNFLMRELLKHNGIWDCIFICNMKGWTNADESLDRVCEKLGFFMGKHMRTFAAIPLPDTHEAYLKLLSHNRREQVRRKMRRLKELHNIELVCCEYKDKLTELLQSLFHLHHKRWESVGQTGSFIRRPSMKRFYESFAPVALQKGWLRLHALKVDGTFKAAQYGYVYNNTYHILQEGFDPNSLGGIGNILRNLVLKECINEGLKEYDFLGEFTDHKRFWNAKPRDGYDLFIGRKSTKNKLLFWKNIWPTGRFIREGRPANEGYSHD